MIPGSLEGKQFGAYTIQGEIARGGQGVVLRARHEPTGREVALKILGDPSPARRKRFLQEARVLARLEHPGLIGVHDCGEQGGMAYMALELVDGQDLAARVGAQGVPDFEWTRRVVAEVADTLHYCHAAGVVHRDVKPANVLIERGTERTLVVDFGMVRRDPEKMGMTSLDEGTVFSRTGELKGTPAFMAPEQVNSGKFGEVSARTDVYALGGLLYFLLSGSQPFAADQLATLLVQILGADPESPAARNPAVPAPLAELALRALAKRQEDRPPSAAAFAAALRAAGPAAPAARSGRPKAAALAVSLALNLGLAAAVAAALARATPAAAPAPSWEAAVEAARQGPLPPERLEALRPAAVDQPWARWLPLLSAQSALDRGDHQAAAARLRELPPSPERALLLAEVAARAGDPAAAFERLGEADGAALPWGREPLAERWGRLVEALALAERTDLAARAALRAGADLPRAEALRWVGRAFQLDPREAAVHGEVHGPALLEAAAAILAGGAADPARISDARRYLVWYRHVLPAAPIPRETLDALFALGESPVFAVRAAAFPGCGYWWQEFAELRALLTTPLTRRDRERMDSSTSAATFPQPWKRWIAERAQQQRAWQRRAMIRTYLLWRPDFPFLWTDLGKLEVDAGRPGWAERACEAAIEQEPALPFVWFRLGYVLQHRGKLRESAAALERGLDAAGSARDAWVQWGAMWLADTHLLTGRPQAALDALSLVGETWMGGRPLYWSRREDALRELGRAAEADAAAERVRVLSSQAD